MAVAAGLEGLRRHGALPAAGWVLAWLGTPAAALMLTAACGPRAVSHAVAGLVAWAVASAAGGLLWHGASAPLLCVPQAAVWLAIWGVEARLQGRRRPGCVALQLMLVLASGPSMASLGWQTPLQWAAAACIAALAVALTTGPLAGWRTRAEAAARGPAGRGVVAAGLVTLAASVWVSDLATLGPTAPAQGLALAGVWAAWRWAGPAGLRRGD